MKYGLVYSGQLLALANQPWAYINGGWRAGGLAFLSLPAVGPESVVYNEAAGGSKITPLAFRRRLTGAERVAMVVAARAQNPQGAEMQVLMDDLAVAQYIDLTDPFVAEALDVLVTRNVITADRKNEILNTPPTIDEVPNGAG